MRLLMHNIGILTGILVPGISRLQGKEMRETGRMENAWLLVEDAVIKGWGSMEELPAHSVPADEIFDVQGGLLMPAFCDSHTHIVYAGSREGEFVDRINGMSYEEIARRGGGILNSADRLRKASEEELYRQAHERVWEMIRGGTASMEIKSGYGLTTKDEIKMLRVIKRLSEETPAAIKATFLGAHVVPREYQGRPDDYVALICKEMLPAVAAEGLADFVDVFCDRGFFTPDQTARILDCAATYGIRGKIHANELGLTGGIQTGVEGGALSVDHLEHTGEEEIKVLVASETMPTLLPGAAFFLGMDYPPARRMIDAGLGVALASDYNPGSSPSGNMKLILSLACIQMKMTPTEAMNAATVNGAYALGLQETHGSITVGKRADLLVTRPVPSPDFLPYAYGSDLTAAVFIGGINYRG